MNPFKIGESVMSPSKHLKKEEKGEILEIQKDLFGYIHFNNTDKRLDEWVPLTQLSRDNELSKNVNFQKRLDIKKNLNTSQSKNKIIRNIDSIRIGDNEIDAWYFSPYPSEFCKSRHLYICEYCFKYFNSPKLFQFHCHTKNDSRPKGLEIYRKGTISIFEISSKTDRFYCQSLFLLSKLFLEDSSLSYIIDNITYLILCECDENGAHPIGFLSRPTDWDGNIIFYEIVILPPFQKQGYSQLLLSCVYEMAHRSLVIGGVGRSLTDLGKPALKRFFINKIVDLFGEYLYEITTVTDITAYTSICKNDVIDTLKDLNIFPDDGNKLKIDDIEDFMQSYKKTEGDKFFDKEFLMWFTEKFDDDDDENESDSEHEQKQ